MFASAVCRHEQWKVCRGSREQSDKTGLTIGGACGITRLSGDVADPEDPSPGVNRPDLPEPTVCHNMLICLDFPGLWPNYGMFL